MRFDSRQIVSGKTGAIQKGFCQDMRIPHLGTGLVFIAQAQRCELYNGIK